MIVPFRVRRTTHVRPATALLLPGHDGAALVQLCARHAFDPPPDVFAVADGFLLRLHRPCDEPIAGVVRLAEIGANLLLPADAELIPALLPDESGALGKQRGLVFLPAGRVLEFDPQSPLPWSMFLQPSRWLESNWSPLPETRGPAEHLVEVSLDLPDDPQELLQQGGEGIGVEEPRPPDASLPSKAAGRTLAGLGQGLSWLGQMLHLQALAQAGAGMMSAGMSMFPRLSEKLLGQQEAGLRELLREFSEGDVEKALRRALPINAPLARGADFHQNANLPVHDTRYSLSNIVGGGGVGGIWLTRDELFRQLEQAYRLQAQQATKRGDYRRAAFIYGKLLHDYRSAASALSQGGLHHDAAILYLELLHDPHMAASEFEAGGEVDRALALYRQLREHVRAGDLLRRVGEEELAVAEYQLAADSMVSTGQGHHQAGDLMLQKARRPDLAQRYYEAGWELRGRQSFAVACAHRLAQIHADKGDDKPFVVLLGEAETFFEVPGNEAAAGDFFNHVEGLAQQPALARVREDVHDRVLIALAMKLSQNSFDGFRASNLVPQLFPSVQPREAKSAPLWPANVVTDAQFALRATQPRTPPRAPVAAAPNEVDIQGVFSVVRAVAQCPFTEEIFLGFESGEIACFDPSTNEVSFLLHRSSARVENLVFGGSGDQLVALTRETGGSLQLICFERGRPWTQARTLPLVPPFLDPTVDEAWLFPSLASHAKYLVGLGTAKFGFFFLSLPNLLPVAEFNEGVVPLTAAVLLPAVSEHGSSLALATFDGRDLRFVSSIDPVQVDAPIPCPMRQSRSSPLTYPPLRCMQFGPGHFEFAAPGEGGIYWLRMNLKGNRLERHLFRQICGNYVAAALVREGVAVGVEADRVVHLRISDEGNVKEVVRLPVASPDAIACFPCHRTGELLILAKNGTLTRGRWLP